MGLKLFLQGHFLPSNFHLSFGPWEKVRENGRRACLQTNPSLCNTVLLSQRLQPTSTVSETAGSPPAPRPSLPQGALRGPGARGQAIWKGTLFKRNTGPTGQMPAHYPGQVQAGCMEWDMLQPLTQGDTEAQHVFTRRCYAVRTATRRLSQGARPGALRWRRQ